MLISKTHCTRRSHISIQWFTIYLHVTTHLDGTAQGGSAVLHIAVLLITLEYKSAQLLLEVLEFLDELTEYQRIHL